MTSARASAGRLEAIWVKRMKRGPMDRVVDARLVAGRGLAGSADQGGRRQVTILSREAWDDAMRELGGRVDASARRANLLVSGVALAGTRGRVLALGATRVRILGELTPCERMEEALAGLEEALRSGWRGGVFGEVLGGGVVRVGDAVDLVPDAP